MPPGKTLLAPSGRSRSPGMTFFPCHERVPAKGDICPYAFLDHTRENLIQVICSGMERMTDFLIPA